MPDPKPHSQEYVSLKEYLERIIHELDRRYDQRFTAADIALDKAEELLKEYKEGSNEWRQTVAAQRDEFVPRLEAKADLRELRTLIEVNSKVMADLQQSVSKIVNRSEGGESMNAKMKAQSQWIIGLMVTSVLSMLGMLASFAYNLIHRGDK